MSHGTPARAAAASTRSISAGRRRRRALLVVLPCLALLAVTALATRRGPMSGTPPVEPRESLLRHGRRGGAAQVAWPAQGQAAFALGDRRPAFGPGQQPVPIASLAKVMTAYLILERYPLSGAQEGFTVTLTPADARAADADAAQGQSIVRVQAGERLSERQLLEALLIPSGNNIAEILAALAAGSEPGFLEEMNATARRLGMSHTLYTDPSGFDPATVSTAADQLRLLRHAMRFPVFREVVAMDSVTLPVAGTLTNFNPLIAAGYAGKTGSDSAAGGCLAFFTEVTVGGHPQTAAGVVLGQGQGSNTRALLAAAGEAAERMVESVRS